MADILRNKRESARPASDPLAELNRRLTVVRDRVRGVALGHNNGFYLHGPAGCAKTYTVIKTLEEEKCPYHYHDGHVTAMGLFDLLAQQHDRVIVLDDVSEIFAQKVAQQLLLAALGNAPDETGVRIVKYRRQGVDETIHFTGGIIMVSNLELNSGPVLQALKSRVHYLRYTPTDEQIADMMRTIAAKGWRTLKPEECMEVTDFLIGESKRLGSRLDLRHLVDKAFPDYLQHQNGEADTHWKDLIRTTLEEKLVDLTHTAPASKLSRAETKEQEQALVREIVAEYQSKEERVAAWQEQSGKSERAFYRRLEEVGPVEAEGPLTD